MKIETNALRPHVRAAARIATAGSKHSIPILSHISLDGTNDALEVTATDLDAFSNAVVDKKSGKLSSRLCVPAKSFLSAVEDAGEFMELELLKNQRLQIKSAGWKREIAVLPDKDFPIRPDVKGMKELVDLPCKDLAHAIEAVAWAADPNPEDFKYWKQSVLVELQPKELRACAGAGTTFAIFRRPLICATATFQLHVKAAIAFCAALRSEEAKLLLGPKHVAVHHEGGFVSAVLPSEAWPNYKPIIESKRIQLGACKIETLLPALERAQSVYAEKKWSPVDIATIGGGWTLSASSQTDSFAEELVAEDKIKLTANVRVNSDRLIDALKHMDKTLTPPVFSMTPDGVDGGGFYVEQNELLWVAGKLMKMKEKKV